MPEHCSQKIQAQSVCFNIFVHECSDEILPWKNHGVNPN